MWTKFTAKKLKWRGGKDTYYFFIKIFNLQNNCLISVFEVFTAWEVLSSKANIVSERNTKEIPLNWKLKLVIGLFGHILLGEQFMSLDERWNPAPTVQAENSYYSIFPITFFMGHEQVTYSHPIGYTCPGFWFWFWQQNLLGNNRKTFVVAEVLKKI